MSKTLRIGAQIACKFLQGDSCIFFLKAKLLTVVSKYCSTYNVVRFSAEYCTVVYAHVYDIRNTIRVWCTHKAKYPINC